MATISPPSRVRNTEIEESAPSAERQRAHRVWPPALVGDLAQLIELELRILIACRGDAGARQDQIHTDTIARRAIVELRQRPGDLDVVVHQLGDILELTDVRDD